MARSLLSDEAELRNLADDLTSIRLFALLNPGDVASASAAAGTNQNHSCSCSTGCCPGSMSRTLCVYSRCGAQAALLAVSRWRDAKT